MGRIKFLNKANKVRRGKGINVPSGEVLIEHQTELFREEEAAISAREKEEREREEYQQTHYKEEGCTCMFRGFKGECILERRERWFSSIYRY
jgi:hypothetical protein